MTGQDAAGEPAYVCGEAVCEQKPAPAEQEAGRRMRFREYAIEPDREPDGEPVTYAAQCAVCEEIGPAEKDEETGTDWMLAHLRANPEHLTYREIVTRPYLAVPGGRL
ncbi:DUF7848 domain-containing protein [Streptomyces alkaliphilus]|uniref:DUF7848 domain-containing protein n=1 Tax=Streptomyces alkaliphilus TaxID=1472722 RepID=UPI0027BA43EB|nr:hypothetical protein [Streptomyces alkaliphilus]